MLLLLLQLIYFISSNTNNIINSEKTQTINNMAQFFIQTDKDAFFAGQTVHGKVFLMINTFIPQAQGISLSFTGYECVKWLSYSAVPQYKNRNRMNKGQHRPKPPKPIPQKLIFNAQQIQDVSDVEEQNDRSYDHRPKYVRVNGGTIYKMAYYQSRNTFTKNNVRIYNCNGLAPGQYSFPFSFKTFEGWPATFQYYTSKKKGKIIYRLFANIDSSGLQLNMSYPRQIILRQTKQVNTLSKKQQAQIQQCCCCGKGKCGLLIHLQKDGYAPGEQVRLVIQVDNSQCSADIKNIILSVTNTMRMNAQGSSTSDTNPVLVKTINGISAHKKAIGNQRLYESFTLVQQQGQYKEIKPTCSGKLLSNNYQINVRLNHDLGSCCANGLGSSIPIIIFPLITTFQMPPMFQNQWKPQLMPMANMQVSNQFANFNLAQMQPQMQHFPKDFSSDSQSDNQDYGNRGGVLPGIPPNMAPGPNMNINGNMNNPNINMNMNMNQAMNNSNMNMNNPNINANSPNINMGNINMNNPNININPNMNVNNTNMNMNNPNNINMNMSNSNMNMNNPNMNTSIHGNSMNVNMNNNSVSFGNTNMNVNNSNINNNNSNYGVSSSMYKNNTPNPNMNHMTSSVNGKNMQKQMKNNSGMKMASNDVRQQLKEYSSQMSNQMPQMRLEHPLHIQQEKMMLKQPLVSHQMASFSNANQQSGVRMINTQQQM